MRGRASRDREVARWRGAMGLRADVPGAVHDPLGAWGRKMTRMLRVSAAAAVALGIGAMGAVGAYLVVVMR